MDLNAVPYMIVSRDLELCGSTQRIYLCLCLVDHLVLGVGATRDEALSAMTTELDAKYGDERDADNFLSLN
jgi:hypothetical protein